MVSSILFSSLIFGPLPAYCGCLRRELSLHFFASNEKKIHGGANVVHLLIRWLACIVLMFVIRIELDMFP